MNSNYNGIPTMNNSIPSNNNMIKYPFVSPPPSNNNNNTITTSTVSFMGGPGGPLASSQLPSTLPPFQYTPLPSNFNNPFPASSSNPNPNLNPNSLITNGLNNTANLPYLNSSNNVVNYNQSGMTLKPMRADRHTYPITGMKFGHKNQTHITTTIIGTRGEDIITRIRVMFRLPAIFHKSQLPVPASCNNYPGYNNENNMYVNNNNSGVPLNNYINEENRTNNNNQQRPRRNSYTNNPGARNYSSDKDTENGTTYSNNNYPNPEMNNPNNPDPNNEFQEYWVRRVDRFARVAIKRAMLKRGGERKHAAYSIITEIKDNVTGKDIDNWERIGRYGDDNIEERTADSKEWAYYSADLRFHFTEDSANGNGLPNFLFPGFELEIEWASFDSLFEWSDRYSRPYVLDGKREMSSKDVEAEIKVKCSPLTEEAKQKWKQRIIDALLNTGTGLTWSWDEYVCRTEPVRDLPVNVPDIEDTRIRAFSLSSFLTGSAKGIFFFVQREVNHLFKRHFDWTGLPEGKTADPIVKYKITRQNKDLIGWTDAIEARTINFEDYFEGKAPKDLCVYYENFENLELTPFIGINSNNDVKLEVMFQENIGPVYFTMFVQVVNNIIISPAKAENGEVVFDMRSSYYSNLQAIEQLALMLANTNQPYLQQQQAPQPYYARMLPGSINNNNNGF